MRSITHALQSSPCTQGANELFGNFLYRNNCLPSSTLVVNTTQEAGNCASENKQINKLILFQQHCHQDYKMDSFLLQSLRIAAVITAYW